MIRRFIGFYAHKKFWMLVHLGPPRSKALMAATCLLPYFFGAPLRHERLTCIGHRARRSVVEGSARFVLHADSGRVAEPHAN